MWYRHFIDDKTHYREWTTVLFRMKALNFLRVVTNLFVFVALLLTTTSCAKQEIVAHDLDEREANEILVFLSGRGVPATKEKAEGGGGGGSSIVKWNISVPEERRQEAMAVLSQAGLPRRQGQNLLELFKESGLVPSEMQQKIRFQAGLAEQIASIIRKMDGVVDADVQLSFPEEDPLNPAAKKGKVTASVYVKHTGVLNDPNSHMISNIKWLVAGSVPGLNYDDVTVVPDLARYRESAGGTGDETFRAPETPLVSIWTIILAKDSVTRFRIVFFSFCITIILLLFVLSFLIWKVSTVLGLASKQHQLLSFGRIDPEALVKKEEPKPEAGKEPADKDGKKKKKEKEKAAAEDEGHEEYDHEEAEDEDDEDN